MSFRKTQITQTIDRWFRPPFICCAIVFLFGTGCRQRAYTELYVESMASEIRMLEDRVFEYDAAYLEKDAGYESAVQELDRLRKKTAELQRQLSMLKHPDSSSPSLENPPLRLRGQPRVPSETVPDESLSVPTVLIPDSIKLETIENPPVVPRTPVSPPPLNSKSRTPDDGELLPQAQPNLLEKAKNLQNEPQASNGNRFPKSNFNLPAVDSLTEQVSMPDEQVSMTESMVRSAQQPKLMVTPSQPSNLQPSDSSPPTSAPSLLRRAFPKIKDNDTQGAIQRGMIRLPEGSKVQFASAIEPASGAKLIEVVDNKIVEIAFHSTLCRGHNFDDRAGDDGLYLVVTPINAIGQVLNQTGTLTVVVEDAAETKVFGRIASWEFTPEQLAETLEPIGTAQGFHLSLPWQDKIPTSKIVTVFLRYSIANGRTLVNRRDVHLRINSTDQPVWTPRKSTTLK